MPTTTIRVDADLLQRVEDVKPSYLSTTGFFQLLAEKGLQGVTRLDGATEPASGQPSLGRSPSKSSSSSSNARALFAKEIPGNLFAHEALIQNYWKAKPKTKTEPAWKLLIRELTKIQEAHGDKVVINQLVQAEANRWQSITLRNYEQFGLDKANTHQKASGLDYEAMDAIVTPW